MDEFYIYIYSDPRVTIKDNFEMIPNNFLPLYVGKGKRDRLYHHLKYLEKGYKGYNQDLKKEIRNILSDGFEPIIIKLFENLSENDAFLKERLIIELIGKREDGGYLLNKTNGGNGFSGYKYSPERLVIAKEEYYKRFPINQTGENHPMYGKYHTQETKDMISKSHKNLPQEYINTLHERFPENSGETHPMYGKHHKEETKKILSLKNTGKKHTDDSKRKISEANKGRIYSEETKDKISKKLRGRKLSEDHKQKLSIVKIGKKTWNYGISNNIIIQYDLNLGFIKEWDNLIDLESAGFQKSNVINVCKGNRKSHRGFIWKYKTQ